MKTLPVKEILFLTESNAIEDVWDADSLQQAIYAWEYLKEQKRLDPGVILKTHKILMLHQHLQPNEKGYWRNCEVMIGGRMGKPYYVVPMLMGEWMRKANKSKTWKEIKADHISYEFVHPFVDGNGRTGRMFMNWQRLKSGLPIMVIYEKAKQKYYQWFL
jgi:Fic family protein